MDAPRWQLATQQARLEAGDFSAAIDLRNPARGFFDIRCGKSTFSALQLLAVDRAPDAVAGAHSTPECYIHGDEFVASYPPAKSETIHVDARWKAIAVPDCPAATALEIVVSVWTDLLHGRAELAVASTVSCAEALRLEAVSGRLEPVQITANRPLALRCYKTPGCFLIRLPESENSLVHLVHPADFRRDEVAAVGWAPTARFLHHLFSGAVEKGVMLRARVRSLLVPRSEDRPLATECYSVLSAAEPPLGS